MNVGKACDRGGGTREPLLFGLVKYSWLIVPTLDCMVHNILLCIPGRLGRRVLFVVLWNVWGRTLVSHDYFCIRSDPVVVFPEPVPIWCCQVVVDL